MGNYEHDILEHKMCKEVEMIEEKHKAGTAEMSLDDLKKLDLLYHTLKSKATYDAMKDAENYGYEREQSGRSMPRMSGHYYDERDGYSGGYYPPRPRW